MHRRSYLKTALLRQLSAMHSDAGFHFDWRRWYRWAIPGTPSDYPVGVIADPSETQEEGGAYTQGGGVLSRALDVSVYGIHNVPSTEDDAPDLAGDAMLADIQRGVMADPTLGGVAIDTKLTGDNKIILGDRVEVEQTIRIEYRTARKDPSQAI